MFLCGHLCWEIWLAFLIWSIPSVGVGKLASLGDPALLRGSQTLAKLVHKMSRSLKYVVSLNDLYIFLQEFWIYWNFEVNSLVAQVVKNLPAMQETWVRPLGQEDPLEKEMATHSIILVWKIPWMEEPGKLQSMGSQRVGHDWATNTSLCFCFWSQLMYFCSVGQIVF